MAYPMYQPHIDFSIMQMQECTPGCILLILSKLNIIPKIRERLMPLPYFDATGNRTAGEIPVSEGSAAGGGRSDPSEWPWSTRDEGF